MANPSKNAVVSCAERGQTTDTGGKEGPGKGQIGLGGAASIGIKEEGGMMKLERVSFSVHPSSFIIHRYLMPPIICHRRKVSTT